MAMSQSALAAELTATELYDDVADAIQAWADAYAAYFEGNGVTEGAQSNAVYVASGAIPAAKAAMVAAMGNLASNAAAAIESGIIAFWGALVPATAWPTTTAITPPTLLSGLASTLQSVFDANTNSNATKVTAMGAIAEAVHTASQGGTATWPSIGPQPII